MHCQNCGNQNIASAGFCSGCGAALTVPAPTYPTQYYGQQPQLPQQPYAYQQYSQQPPFYVPPQENSSSKGLGVTGVVFGLVGMVTFCIPYLGIIFGVTGLVFSFSGKRAALQGEPFGSSTAGLVVSSIAIAISFVLIVLDIVLWLTTGTGIFYFYSGDFSFGLGAPRQ